jgi:uncharacterized protein (TIGR00369 family)
MPDDFAVLQQRFAANVLHQQLGLTLEEAREGYARIALATNAVTLSGVGGSVHGGVLAAMVDIAMLQALIASLGPADIPNGTADLNITYLRPSLGNRIVAEATILRKGRSLAVSEVSITDGEGRLCAKGRTIYALRQRAG